MGPISRNIKFSMYFVVFILSSTLLASDISVPADYSTIQAAINAAGSGETITVSQGTYVENINFGGKDIILTSTDINNPAATVIDGNAAGSVVTFSGSETSACEIRGFTITNGDSFLTDYGAGINGGSRSNPSMATISNCTITGNTGAHGGLSDCNGPITNCTITGNTGDFVGGMSYCNGPITSCTITGNTSMFSGGGLFYCNGPITNCIITGNNSVTLDGGGLSNCDGPITNCTITGNTAALYGGGLRSCSGTISNCIVWGNSANDGGDQLFESSIPTYSCIQDGDAGTGNISSDPQFVTGPLGDYYLDQDLSPCVDSGSDTAANLGMDTLTTALTSVMDSGIVDMGYHSEIFAIDINSDGDVNLKDFAVLASQWQGTPGAPSADIAPYPDGDNLVDWDDLLLLIENWLK